MRTSVLSLLLEVIYSETMGTAGQFFILLFLIAGTSCQTLNEGCGGTMSMRSGTITSPGFPENYPDNIKCQWNITTQTHDIIELRFQHFHLQNHTNCSYDYVSVYDGFDSNKTLLVKYCGTTFSNLIWSKTEKMQIEFRADGSNTFKGFSVTFTGQGCGGHFNQMTGMISSPGYPRAYPPNIKCQWNVTATKNEVIELRFLNVLLESCSSCGCDYVAVYGGNGSNQVLLGKFCSNVSSPLISRGVPMQLVFVTDGGYSSKGFTASFAKTCSSGWYGPDCNLTCSQNCVKSSSGPACSHVDGRCPSGCMPGFLGEKCDASCGGTLTQSIGFITSPGYPVNYPNRVRCQWNVTAQKNEEIHLRFFDLIMEVCSSCGCDSVSVYSGNNSNQVLMGKFCSNNVSSPLISKGKTMQLLLVTDGSSAYKGFNATFTKACSSGWYGPDCNLTCSQNCVKSSNRTACNHVDGRCLAGCTTGFQGDTCEKVCSTDKYGQRCLSKCSPLCARTTSTTSSCDHINGDCLNGCQDGYQGLKCETPCDEDRYGPGCLSHCSQNCRNDTVTNTTCHHIDGHCLSGCLDGFYGELCEKVWSETIKITSATVACALLIAALILLFVLVYLRRKRKHTEANTDQDLYMNVEYINKTDKPQPKKVMSSATRSSGVKETRETERATEETTNSYHDKFYDSPENPETASENEYITIGDASENEYI